MGRNQVVLRPEGRRWHVARTAPLQLAKSRKATAARNELHRGYACWRTSWPAIGNTISNYSIVLLLPGKEQSLVSALHNCTSDLIFFNSGALPNILHYITLHSPTTLCDVTTGSMIRRTSCTAAVVGLDSRDQGSGEWMTWRKLQRPGVSSCRTRTATHPQPTCTLAAPIPGPTAILTQKLNSKAILYSTLLRIYISCIRFLSFCFYAFAFFRFRHVYIYSVRT